ncbi:MAG: ABC-2 transporter permease [Candidatus Methanomethylophilaceae archaeon]
MMTLVRKDLILIRSSIVSLSIFAAVLCFLLKDPLIPHVLPAVLLVSLASASIRWDEQCNWDRYIVSIGVDRNTIVRSKFATGAILALIGTVTGLVISISMSYVHDFGDGASMVTTCPLGFIVGIIVSSVSVAVYYITGNSVKAQYISVVANIVVISALIALSMIAAEAFGDLTLVVLALAAVAAVVVHICCSVSRRRFAGIDL